MGLGFSTVYYFVDLFVGLYFSKKNENTPNTKCDVSNANSLMRQHALHLQDLG